MLPQVRALVGEAEAPRIEVLERIRSLTPEQGAFRSGSDRWSVAEVVEHLVRAELSGLHKISVALVGWRRGEPVWTGDHAARDATIEAIVARTWREREAAPPIAEPTMGGPLPFWAAAFRSCQHVLNEVAEGIADDELDEVVYPHYLSGPLTLRQRLEFIRFHIQRHRSQIESIRDDPAFPAGAAARRF